MSKVIKILKTLGYEHRGNLGVEGREAFNFVGVSSAEGTTVDSPIARNLYVCLKDCLALKNHLLLRDFLRMHSWARDQYSQLKKELAEKFPHSVDSYVDGKTDFILSVLEKQGLSQTERESVTDINLLPHKKSQK